RGFKSRRPDFEERATRTLSLCSTSTFFGAIRQAAPTLDHARISVTVFGGIMPATPKRHAMVFHGFCGTVRAFRTVPKPTEKSGIINQDEVATNSIGYVRKCGRRGDRSWVQIPPARFFRNG